MKPTELQLDRFCSNDPRVMASIVCAEEDEEWVERLVSEFEGAGVSFEAEVARGEIARLLVDLKREAMARPLVVEAWRRYVLRKLEATIRKAEDDVAAATATFWSSYNASLAANVAIQCPGKPRDPSRL